MVPNIIVLVLSFKLTNAVEGALGRGPAPVQLKGVLPDGKRVTVHLTSGGSLSDVRLRGYI